MPITMAPFRACLSCSSRVSILRPNSISNIQRILRYTSTVTRSTPKKTAPLTKTPTRASQGPFRPEWVRFLKKSEPTLLVETTSPVAYRVGQWLLGGGCIIWSVYTFFDILYEPQFELTYFVKATFGSVVIMMGVFGLYCLAKTRRIVSSISVVPYTMNKVNGQKGLMLRIQTYPAIPFPGRIPKTHEIPVDTAFASDPLGIPGSFQSSPFPPTKDDKIVERLWQREQRKKKHKSDMERLMTLPFREAGYWISRGFNGMRDLFWDDSFVKLKAKGRNGTWKIDRDFAWALDNGHAFDRVVKIEIF